MFTIVKRSRLSKDWGNVTKYYLKKEEYPSPEPK
jgi:hypothetical protein